MQDRNVVLRFEVSLENTGQSPAGDVTIKAALDGTSPEDDGQTMRVRDIAGGDKRQEQVARSIPSEDLRRGEDSFHSITFGIYVTAVDVFGHSIDTRGSISGSIRVQHGALASLQPNRTIQVAAKTTRLRLSAIGTLTAKKDDRQSD